MNVKASIVSNDAIGSSSNEIKIPIKALENHDMKGSILQQNSAKLIQKPAPPQAKKTTKQRYIDVKKAAMAKKRS